MVNVYSFQGRYKLRRGRGRFIDNSDPRGKRIVFRRGTYVKDMSRFPFGLPSRPRLPVFDGTNRSIGWKYIRDRFEYNRAWLATLARWKQVKYGTRKLQRLDLDF